MGPNWRLRGLSPRGPDFHWNMQWWESFVFLCGSSHFYTKVVVSACLTVSINLLPIPGSKLSPLGSKRGLQAIYDRPKGGNFLDSNSSCAFGPTKPRRVKTHQLDLLPSQLASGKWRFRLGSWVNPTHQDLKNHRKKLILLSIFFLSGRFVSFSTGKNK